ncbi:alpha/beta hydrolase [Lysobacter sp. K5869]|uniref:esterase/lipase family protein n=1 Tax=Lysobacter sp. K5869 TaxID=2820808 RepID=UPI0021018B1B|nr:alpha/beta hydrolase [Lysobacter sp. K5869]
MRLRLCLILSLLLIGSAHAGTVLSVPPERPERDRTYVFYLHGRIVEDRGVRPVDTRFGLYDYPAILDALSARGATVVSSQRPHDADVNESAGRVVAQIEGLLRAGVPEQRIVVVGFSKGGMIATHVSSFLRRPGVRYVLLAACWDRQDEPQLRLTGRVLAMRETSDDLAGKSCRSLAERSERPVSFEELSLSTGKSHGAFYLPRREWLEPALDWIHAPAQAPRDAGS